jgi:hypothetical protein
MNCICAPAENALLRSKTAMAMPVFMKVSFHP